MQIIIILIYDNDLLLRRMDADKANDNNNPKNKKTNNHA